MTPAAPSSLFERLDAALPQTQCTRCGYPDCAAYAQAMASGDTPINQCPPGGAEGIARLASISGQAELPLNPLHGAETPRAVAVIDERWCIGCTLCLPVCPTDAIFGSNKAMHSVIEPHCTGCGLCLPVCPVDCISLQNVTGERTGWAAWSDNQARQARQRYQTHRLRLVSGQQQSSSEARSDSDPASTGIPAQLDTAAGLRGATAPADGTLNAEAAVRKRAVVDAALARARALRQK